jgi:DNA polymerase/3'-5' exonuclease PolX
MMELFKAALAALVKGLIETFAGYGQLSEEDLKAARDAAIAEIEAIDLAELLQRAKEKQLRGAGV